MESVLFAIPLLVSKPLSEDNWFIDGPCFDDQIGFEVNSTCRRAVQVNIFSNVNLEDLTSPDESNTSRALKNMSLCRRHMPQPSPRTECLLQLVMVQLAALLQLTQLWTVLGGLTSAAPADAMSIADNEGSWALDFLVDRIFLGWGPTERGSWSHQKQRPCLILFRSF